MVLNYSWCGVRLDHRRREAGLSLYPSTCTGKGALLKRQPPDVGISQLREPFASEGRPSKQTKQKKREKTRSDAFPFNKSSQGYRLTNVRTERDVESKYYFISTNIQMFEKVMNSTRPKLSLGEN